MDIQEFKVNDYIKLKFENGKTNIFVNNEYFNQCKYLLTRKKVNDYEDLLAMESIDELANHLKDLNEEIETESIEIPPETQFWAHCSNMQVWVEHNYDTRLLHSNLAFPLLKKLTEIGDPKAKKVFKEEIAIRFKDGINSTRDFLIREGYLAYLDREEKKTIFPLEVSILEEIEENLSSKFILFSSRSNILITSKRERNQLGYSIDGEQIKIISFYNCDFSKEQWDWIIEKLSGIPYLKNLHIKNSNIVEISSKIGELLNLVSLELNSNQLYTLPESIGNLKGLKKLYLSYNQLNSLPRSIGGLESLEFLDLENNLLIELPESIGNLINLKGLRLLENILKSLPESICNMKSLEVLHCTKNQIEFIPRCIGKLKNLKTIFLNDNSLKTLPDSILELNSLDSIYLDNNRIDNSNEVVKKLKTKTRVSI